MRRTFSPYRFLVDLYRYNDAYYDESGQKVTERTFAKTIKVSYMPARGEERLVGRVQNPRSYTFWTDDVDINVNDQLRNLRDREGNVIEPGAMNIVYVKPFPRMGLVRHVEVNAQVILD